MKPRAFIGSSVEGLDVAYAIQQNLLHDVEATVWTQGVFELSATTIESLTDALNNNDFAIFAFTPDDVSKIRGKESATVRDNVLFELGLFIGRLGRERVFFVTPADSEMHMPTDLLGITAGRFDAARSDKNLKAATGPVCHEMRTKIQKLGLLNPEKIKPNEPEASESEALERNWLYEFATGNYSESKIKINEKLRLVTDAQEKDDLLTWLRYVEYKADQTNGIKSIVDWLDQNKTKPRIIQLLFRFLHWEGFNDEVISLADTLGGDAKNFPSVKAAISDCYVALGETEAAKNILRDGGDVNSELTTKLVDLYSESGDHFTAFSIAQSALKSLPNDENLQYKCARTAIELKEIKIALYLLRNLTRIAPENPEYWGYLGNCCLDLDFHDQALVAYRKADELSEEKAEWICGNIGNLFSNLALPSEAINHLKRALALNEDSAYAHDRLSQALNSKKERENSLESVCDEGRLQLRNWKKPDIRTALSGGLLGSLLLKDLNLDKTKVQ